MENGCRRGNDAFVLRFGRDILRLISRLASNDVLLTQSCMPVVAIATEGLNLLERKLVEPVRVKPLVRMMPARKVRGGNRAAVVPPVAA
jgi:hypothetical protein